jgi:galactokinase
VPAERCVAFAPGRVNLIGEHTDYNQGLALPFAIEEGVTVLAEARPAERNGAPRVQAHASDFGEDDEFPLSTPSPAEGWRAFVHGTVAELARAGYPLVGARLRISADVPAGSGLSSSAALEVALCLGLIGLAAGPASGPVPESCDRIALARLCARVEHDWVGAHTGLLDQLASLYGAPDTALCIDFRAITIEPVPLRLDGWRLFVLDSGERHVHASSGYNERREECARACELLGVSSLRELETDPLPLLPEPLGRRASHVYGENQRVLEAAAALRTGDLGAVAELLSASHRSLRDLYEVSTPAVEAAVGQLLQAGAAGARLIGGGFGGSVLGLFAPGVRAPAGVREVRPGAGARLL